MSGIRPRLSHIGPNTYEAGAPMKGGMLVEGRPGDTKMYPAQDGSATVLGVCEVDCKPWVNPVSVDVDGFDTINVSPLPTEGSVGFARYSVRYTTDCGFGDALVAAANGAVRRFNATDPDGAGAGVADSAHLIVGYCDEPGGVIVASKPVALANISR